METKPFLFPDYCGIRGTKHFRTAGLLIVFLLQHKAGCVTPWSFTHV